MLASSRHRLFGLFASSAISLAVGTLVVADEVTLVPGAALKAPGGRFRGTIERETPSEITIDGRNVPLDQVATVTYDQPPATYLQAQAQERGGNTDAAIESYARAATDAGGNKPIANAARVARARLLGLQAEADATKLDSTLAEIDKLATDLATTRHAGPLFELQARLNLLRKNYDQAEAAAKKLSALAWAKDTAEVLQSRVLVGRGQGAQAVARLDAAINPLPADSPKRRALVIARAEAMVAAGQGSEAVASIEQIINASNPEDTATLASAYNALGDCLRADGKARDAVFAYLHTDVLYPKNADLHARALAELVRTWRDLKDSARAEQTLERLRQAYPNSPYLAQLNAK